jgi:hypothetical protein
MIYVSAALGHGSRNFEFLEAPTFSRIARKQAEQGSQVSTYASNSKRVPHGKRTFARIGLAVKFFFLVPE